MHRVFLLRNPLISPKNMIRQHNLEEVYETPANVSVTISAPLLTPMWDGTDVDTVPMGHPILDVDLYCLLPQGL